MWRIPVKIVIEERRVGPPTRRGRTKRFTCLEPAVTLLGVQRLALNSVLRNYPVLESVDGKWQFRGHCEAKTHLPHMGAVRATTDDPEDHLVWGPRPVPLGDMKPREAERRAWLEDLLARGGGQSIEQLSFQWRAFCVHIAHTLLNREEPVDCYLFKLHNCPLRPRWHEEFFWKKIKCEPKPFLKHLWFEPWLLEFYVAGDHCVRQIELEPTREWRRLTIKVEAERRRRLGPERYAQYYATSVRRFTPVAWRLHKAWWAEMAFSRLIHSAGGLGRGFTTVSDKVAREMCRKTERHRNALRTVHRRKITIRLNKALSRKNGRVSPVSDLRPEAQDVRQPEGEGSGPAVEKPGDGKG